jgi:DNA-directed RNA polymerase specialized sigma24 family protein
MNPTNPFADNAPIDLEDRVLVTRARSGNRAALEALVQRHQGWIYNIAVRMLSHPQDAEDATQEILIKAVTQLSSFEGRRGKTRFPHSICAYWRLLWTF